jgi:hypothetical protein
MRYTILIMKKVLYLLMLIAVFGISGCASPDIEIRTFETPSEYQVTKAKNVYREANPTCEVCGAKSNITNGNRNPVHHRMPVHVAPELAATQSNLVTLCRRHHFWVGHCGNYRAYNANLNKTIEAVRKAYIDNAEKVK